MIQAPTKYRVTVNGAPLSFGKVFFTKAGTNTPLNTYKTPTYESANTYPVILDANGEADVYLLPQLYKETVTDSNGSLIRVRESVSGDVLSSSDADSRYVKSGSASFIPATTRDVIANVRTYTGSLVGVTAYTGGAVIGIVPDAVAVSDTAYYININGLGDKLVVNPIGTKPSLVAGAQTVIIYDGSKFVTNASAALLAGTSILDLVTTSGVEPTKATVSVVSGTATLSATYSGGDAALVLDGDTVNIVANNEEDVTIKGKVAATRDWATSEFSGKQAGIQFQGSGADLGTSATVTKINFAGGLSATRTDNTISVEVPGGGGGGSGTWVSVWTGYSELVQFSELTGGQATGRYLVRVSSELLPVDYILGITPPVGSANIGPVIPFVNSGVTSFDCAYISNIGGTLFFEASEDILGNNGTLSISEIYRWE